MVKLSKRISRMALDLTGYAKDRAAKAAGLFEPFRRKQSGGRLFQNFGFLGVAGPGSLGARIDPFGFNGFLREIGQFNPLYVEPFIQILMRRSVMPRLALIILSSALRERQYVVEGADPRIEKFHQDWVDRLMPQLLARAANAVWFGWQPYVLDWSVGPRGELTPTKAHDVDPFTTDALEDPTTRQFCGLTVDGQDFGPGRAFKLTWEGYLNNHYGEGQALTVYPYWWAHSVLLVWAMRYYERSVDPVRAAMAKNMSIPTGAVDGSGNPTFVDLTDLVAEALDVLGNGDSVAMPLGADGEDMVKIQSMDFPDRSDTWLKMLAYMEQKQLTSALALPGLGIGAQFGEIAGGDARTTEKLQLRVLEFVTDMPIDAINETLLPLVHKSNKLPGPPPRVRGKAFKREREEKLFDLLKTAMAQTMPEVGPDGKVTGRSYRPQDLLRFDKLGQQLDLPLHGIAEVARKEAEMEEPSPGIGGRPKDPLGAPESASGEETRAESRAKGLKR